MTGAICSIPKTWSKRESGLPSINGGSGREEWGEGWGALGERYASHAGQYIIQRSIMFPVQAIDHEDARYFPSRRTTYKGRLADAFLHTVWRHNDSGGMMPAYSEFPGDYGAAALSRYWWPEHYHLYRRIGYGSGGCGH